MPNDLLPALQILRRTATDNLADDYIDHILDVRRPQKPARQEPAEIARELEEQYLTPSASFSTEWLNKLQQRWNEPVNFNGLFRVPPTQSRSVIRFTREGLEGRVTGHREVTVPASSTTAKNSTSLLRKPASRADFVRGAGGFFPFAPGGLESVEAAAALEEQLMAAARPAAVSSAAKLERVISFSAGGLLEAAPGFKRGVSFREDIDADDAVIRALVREPDELADGAPMEEDVQMNEDVEDDMEDDIDSLLPVEFPALQSRGTLPSSTIKKATREWAHMVDVKRDITNFRELVPNMAREWPFELDTFQKEAVYHLENGDSVFVAAHTSAGKTVVAEYAIALAARHMTKAIYTSPIKALSNQKFRDFRQTFDDVGILTGDVQINPEASCLIMTTEILRSMLYRGADLIRDVEFVIFDEVHYVNDLERGVVWEEVIIMLPEHVTLILLSATVPNTYEFASWVGRTKKKDIYVISTPKRPVPLEHYLWANKGIHKIVDSEKRFQEPGWKAANDILSGRDKVKTLQEVARGGSNQRGRGNQRGAPQRGIQRSGQRGRGGPPRASHNPGHMGRDGRPGGRTTAAQDKTLWVHLVQFLKKETLLPACIFVFSKKRCEENADSLSNQDFCTATEKSAIHMTIEKSLARLRPDDRVLPQIVRLKEMLSRGIAVHHGGLLPIVKEVVEILFAQTLVKVLFATETFAMGLNLPTRTVVFSGYRKHDGQQFRNLLPGEYTQMAGRAGRRGLDTVGSVIIVAPGRDEAPPAGELKQMILGEPSKLRSQFRLTYNMILNLLRVEALKIEEMIKRSFSEHATQQLLPEHEKQVKLSEADLAMIKREPCDICSVDLEACHEAAQTFKQLTLDLHLGLLGNPIGKRMFARERLIVFMKDGIRRPGVLLREGASTAGGTTVPSLHVLELKTRRDNRDSTDILPYLPELRNLFTPLTQTKKQVNAKGVYIPVTDLECVTATMTKGIVPQIFEGGEVLNAAREEIVRLTSSWDLEEWDEIDYARIKDMQLRELIEKRRQLAAVVQNSMARECPQFLKHFAMCHDEWLIKENISQLRQLMSDQNLQLLPDYEQRIMVLKDLGYIDEGSRVLLKGRVACEIHSADELVLTELLLENVLVNYEPAEIVSLLSAFVFQEKTDTVPTLTSHLQKGMETIIKLSEKVNAEQTLHQVILSADDSNDFVSRPRFGLMEVVYEWARGMSFKNITDLTDVLEGTIVRVITRLDETCREVKNASRIIGDPELFTKMQTCQEMIKRDITAVASLYMHVKLRVAAPHGSMSSGSTDSDQVAPALLGAVINAAKFSLPATLLGWILPTRLSVVGTAVWAYCSVRFLQPWRVCKTVHGLLAAELPVDTHYGVATTGSLKLVVYLAVSVVCLNPMASLSRVWFAVRFIFFVVLPFIVAGVLAGYSSFTSEIRDQMLSIISTCIAIPIKLVWFYAIPIMSGLTISALQATGLFYDVMVNRSLPKYTYLPLPARHIRLLQVSRPYPYGPIRFELIACDVNFCPPYDAISYARDGGRPHEIDVNGGRLGVSQNVYDILLSRASFFKPRMLWIDSVCINPDNVDEKGTQVQLMADVLQRASQVLMCLGDTHGALPAFLFLDHVCSQTLSTLNEAELKESLQIDTDSPAWPVLFDLMRHPYWGQLSTVQEIALTSSARILYGNVLLSWDKLKQAMRLFSDKSISGLLAAEADRLAARMPIQGQERILAIAELDDSYKESKPSLSSLLFGTVSFDTADPRDRVYAVLGLASSDARQVIVPDYHLSASDIFASALKYSFQHESTLIPLHHAGLGWESTNPDLPSWVADFGRASLAQHFTKPSLPYRASGEWTSHFEVDDASHSLSLSGTQTDELDVCATDLSMDRTTREQVSAGQIKILIQIAALAAVDSTTPYPAGETRSEALWRTLAANRDGSPSSACPASADTGDAFMTALQLHNAVGDESWATADLDELRRCFPALQWDRGDELPRNIVMLMQKTTAFWAAATNGILGRRFALTRGGYFAVVPPRAQKGDMVCLVAGAKTPFLLRRDESSGRLRLVGECYVHGVMDGEKAGAKPQQWFVIH